MHELSIALSIVDLVTSEALANGAGAVTRVELGLGSHSGVVPEALEFAMAEAVKNTLLEKAHIDYRLIEARCLCHECGLSFSPEDVYTPCPQCGNPMPELVHGKELIVNSIDIETLK
jgi:hydrogenase nickel incorporation protein HypA/HybF